MKGQRVGYVRVSSDDQNPDRQMEGIALAKERGAYRGCKKALSLDQVAELRQRAGE